MNAYKQLRQARMQTAQKPFLARGITVKRCQECLLGQQYCICEWLKPFACELPFDVVLLMHRDEILKPTNTGRLIAESFPRQCMAFEWSRLDPPAQLLEILADSQRQCAVVYPARNDRQAVSFASQAQLLAASKTDEGSRKPTLIFLDGTWRQAARMFNHSEWLGHIPFFALDEVVVGEYAMRKASENSRLATAEAASLVFSALKATTACTHLQHIFTVFNQHYAATRACTQVLPSSSHSYLADYDTNI
ncbi:tRNA-uridine aminocarboxypropyltransferase [Marinagarivorans algicola]|uniref:tRNA-uridine aminocarboxypropyltransferase n=1 Tax=Marinagarivorans algicola TaxID=1513270 RepID=UPI003735CD6B